MNKSLQDNQQAGPEKCKSEVERTYLHKTWKLAIYIWKYWCRAIDNPSGETISESSQITRNMKQ